MKGTLEKLQVIQKELIAFTIDKETRNALNTVEEEITKIKEYGDRQWFFTDDNELMTTTDKDGQPFTYIKGKCLEMFYWKDFEELIATIKNLSTGIRHQR